MALDPALTPDRVLAAAGLAWLRPLAPVDRAFHHALYGDPETMRWLGDPLGQAAADAAFDAALAELRRPAGAAPAWRFVGLADGAAAALYAAQPRGAEVAVGAIVAPAARGRGLARQGLAALRDAFLHLRAERIVLDAMAANGPMLGLAATLGFRACATPPRPGWLTFEWPPPRPDASQEPPR